MVSIKYRKIFGHRMDNSLQELTGLYVQETKNDEIGGLNRINDQFK